MKIKPGIYILLIMIAIIAALSLTGLFKSIGSLTPVVKFCQCNPVVNGSEHHPQRVGEIPLPRGFSRIKADPSSFLHWLRQLPLKNPGTPVYLYNGKQKSNQRAHYAVMDISIGKKNLQQCADAIIRLKAEYLYSRGMLDRISFQFTSGHKAPFLKWAEGYRPLVKGNKVQWIRKHPRDISHKNLLLYLETVFTYAGTYSLSREMIRIDDKDIDAGDIFIQGGSPGHAVIIVDIAVSRISGEKIFLLAQSYMPAQDIHILINPGDSLMNPWYNSNIMDTLVTPEWTFSRLDLKRFR